MLALTKIVNLEQYIKSPHVYVFLNSKRFRHSTGQTRKQTKMNKQQQLEEQKKTRHPNAGYKFQIAILSQGGRRRWNLWNQDCWFWKQRDEISHRRTEGRQWIKNLGETL